MSGWDWINAGLEIATYAQAQKARENSTNLKTAIEIDAARRSLLEARKNFIFDISSKIQLANEQVVASPQQVYIVSKSLQLRLDYSDIMTDMFPDFQDKEYFIQTEKRVAEVVKKSKEKLTQEQIDVSEKAVQYIIEMPVLKRAISAKEAQESLVDTEKTWVELSARNGNNQIFALLGFLGILPSCICLMTPIMGGGNYTGLIMLLGLLAIVGSISLIVKGRTSNPQYTTLKSKRENLKQQLISKDEWERVVVNLGDLSSEQFKKIQDERLAFLTPLLGDNF